MKYVKTFFITTILLSTGTTFNAPYDDNYFAYTAEQPTEIPETISSVPIIPIEEIPITEVIAQKTALEEWKTHLATLGEHWDKTNNIPDNGWKTESFRLAESVLEQDKSAAESLKTDFLDAINQQTTQINQAILDLIKEFDDMIAAKLSSLEAAAIKEATPAETTKATPVEEKKEEAFESLPTPAETTPAPVTPESSTNQTSATTETTPGEDQLMQQWNTLIATIKEPAIKKDEANKAFYQINELVGQLRNKKPSQELEKDFDKAFEILKLRKILPPIDLEIQKKLFNKTLFPEESQQAQQFEQNLYQQQLTAEQRKIQEELQKFREEMAAKEAVEKEKREKSEKQIQAALALAQEEKKISEEKARNLAQITKAHTAQLGASAEARVAAAISAKEKETREAFSKTIQQQTTAAKKLAEEQKAAAEQGIFSKAVKAVTDVASNVKNWWYGSSAAPTQGSVTLAELEEKARNDLQAYLDNTRKDPKQKKEIMDAWISFHESLHEASQHLNQHDINSWISNVEQTLTKLVLNDIITIDQACDKIKNALPLPTAPGSDYAAQIVQKIKMDLEHIAWQHNKQKQQAEEHRSQLAQKRQERKEQIMLAQQRIKNEEDRIEAEKKKQLAAAADYKDGKKEWNQLLAQLSQNTQATTEENHAHTMEAIKKSHALLQLAHIIPSKNKQAVSQKLKQNFTIALLDQQRLNDTKLNIHHNMDNFNREINRIVE